MDDFITRAVTDLTFRIPPTAKLEVTLGTLRSPAKLGSQSVMGSESDVQYERWPIPLEPTQMNPRLLLGYACERIVLSG
jgi:hypothetical protein